LQIFCLVTTITLSLFVSSQPVDSSFVLFAATGLTGFCCCFLVNLVVMLTKKRNFFCSSSLIVKVFSVKKIQVWQKVKCHPAWISRKNAFLSHYLSVAKWTTFSNWIISLKTFDFQDLYLIHQCLKKLPRGLWTKNTLLNTSLNNCCIISFLISYVLK
jgi:hypothetical protein